MFTSLFQTIYFEVNSFSIEALLTVVLLAIILIFLVEIIRLQTKMIAVLTKNTETEKTIKIKTEEIKE